MSIYSRKTLKYMGIKETDTNADQTVKLLAEAGSKLANARLAYEAALKPARLQAKGAEKGSDVSKIVTQINEALDLMVKAQLKSNNVQQIARLVQKGS